MYDKIFYGDCEEIMSQLRDEKCKVQTCVTSPPYWGQRDYGRSDEIGKEETIGQYIMKLTKCFRVLKDILSDDGTFWLNIGDKYAHKDMGLIKRGDLCLIPSRLAISLRDNGWYLRQEIIWNKTTCMPEPMTHKRCTRSFEYIYMFTKSMDYYYDYEPLMEPCQEASINKVKKDLERYKKGVFSPRKDPRVGNNYLYDGRSLEVTYQSMLKGRNARNVWTMTPYNRPFNGPHTAMFPPELVKRCVLTGSKEGDVVLDPFMGSGTTALIAKQLNRHYIGIELNSEFKEVIDNRLQEVS